MNAETERKSPEQLEDEITRIRASLDDTLDAIQHKLSPGPMMNQAWDYLKSGPVQFSGNLGATVRDNPVPVSLLGIGLAWLMMSRSDGRNERTEHSVPGLDTNYLAYGSADPRAEEGQRLEESTDLLAGEYKESYDPESYRGIITDKEIGPDRIAYSGEAEYSLSGDSSSGGRFRRAGQSARDVGHRVAESADHTRDRMGRMAHDAGDRLRGGLHGARHAVADFGDVTRDQAARVRESYYRTLHERPLVLGAIGVALGAALGAAFPSTRREDELMGAARDELKHRAEDAGREQLDKASRVADTAGEAARNAAQDVKHAAEDEAERQGLGQPRNP